MASCETRVVIMDNTCIKEKFDKDLSVTGVAILNRLGERLAIPKQDLKHFGLKYPDTDGQMNWLPLSDSVKKHSFKKPYQFQLGVRIYPEANEQLSESCLRLCCYQIKSDLNRGQLSCSASQHAAIDSYFAQAVIGDFTRKTHTPGYLEDFLGSFFMHPSGINCTTEVSARDYENDVVHRHRGHSGMKTKEAWLGLLTTMSTVPDFSPLKHQAKDCSDKSDVQISISEEGVKVYNLNNLNEPDVLKRHLEWRALSNLVCYKNKLLISTSTGRCKFKFRGLYGDKAAHRVLDDILECRLFYNCSVSGTNPLTYHTEESKRNEANEFARGSSKFRSFRNEPVVQRKGSIQRMYSSIRLRFSVKRDKAVPSENIDEEDLAYKARLSRIEILPVM